MKRRWAVLLWASLVAAGIALAAPDDFVQRLLAADQLHRQGDNAGAETILLEELEKADHFGSDNPRKAIVLNNLGSVYHFMDKYQQAEHCYRRAVEIESRLGGTGGDSLIRSVINLAALYIDTGQYAKAERLGLASLAEHQATIVAKSPDFARLLALLGDLEQRRGRYSKAQQYEEDALAIFEELAPDGSQSMVTLNNLCILYGETGRNTDALSYCERALRIAEGTTVQPFMQASLLANVGALQFVVHGTAKAEPFYKKALAIAENALDRQQTLFAHILLSYAVVLDRTSRKVQAEECRRRAKAILEAASMTDPRKFTVDLGDMRRRSSNR
jgi:tetratricopeptide (TPR) repeat protein